MQSSVLLHWEPSRHVQYLSPFSHSDGAGFAPRKPLDVISGSFLPTSVIPSSLPLPSLTLHLEPSAQAVLPSMHEFPLRQDLPLDRVGVRTSHEPPTPRLGTIKTNWVNLCSLHKLKRMSMEIMNHFLTLCNLQCCYTGSHHDMYNTCHHFHTPMVLALLPGSPWMSSQEFFNQLQ